MNKLDQPAEQAQGGFSQDAFTKYVNDQAKCSYCNFSRLVSLSPSDGLYPNKTKLGSPSMRTTTTLLTPNINVKPAKESSNQCV